MWTSWSTPTSLPILATILKPETLNSGSRLQLKKTTRPAFAQLRPVLAERIMGYRDAGGDYGDILLTAQAVSALDMIGSLESGETLYQIGRFVDSQREDGSWPEHLAWDVPLMGMASELLTTAFCIEALERCTRSTGLT